MSNNRIYRVRVMFRYSKDGDFRLGSFVYCGPDYVLARNEALNGEDYAINIENFYCERKVIFEYTDGFGEPNWKPVDMRAEELNIVEQGYLKQGGEVLFPQRNYK